MGLEAQDCYQNINQENICDSEYTRNRLNVCGTICQYVNPIKLKRVRTTDNVETTDGIMKVKWRGSVKWDQ